MVGNGIGGGKGRLQDVIKYLFLAVPLMTVTRLADVGARSHSQGPDARNPASETTAVRFYRHVMISVRYFTAQFRIG